jgi:hypothetical protein
MRKMQVLFANYRMFFPFGQKNPRAERSTRGNCDAEIAVGETLI